MRNIVSLSGGKDSVAMWLWAIRAGLDPVAVYLDTGWEWDGHSKHLDMLEARIGKIHRVVPTKTFESKNLGTWVAHVIASALDRRIHRILLSDQTPEQTEAAL